ncbi:hypothetical protein NPIL_169721 [Nephila pilipes]|uniref:Uncharacterized protein n=1 Tax=Nephila pilipes TaxID=299642 RepID=A0A8X6MEE8_NEPPI|nr:hypothetical protein NPIL_169721 [Nephila pilipes]
MVISKTKTPLEYHRSQTLTIFTIELHSIDFALSNTLLFNYKFRDAEPIPKPKENFEVLRRSLRWNARERKKKSVRKEKRGGFESHFRREGPLQISRRRFVGGGPKKAGGGRAARTRWLLGPESDATLILLRQHHVEGGRREGDFLNPVPSECHWKGTEKLKRRKRRKNKKHSV